MNLPLKQGADCQMSIHVRGLVQGVGFRPAVWRYATELGLTGSVSNDGDGVIILCKGARQQVERLVARLQQQPPEQAKIADIQISEAETQITATSFVIESSQDRDALKAKTHLVADLATCQACLAELFDSGNRRYRYPFTHCTHCGPRLSIVRSLPYDRCNTSMSVFNQCPDCEREYHDPADRRFHAQANACPHCGPRLSLLNAQGRPVAAKEPVSVVVEALRSGKIVAIKGLGGFHLAVDAGNPAAVLELRRRKNRPDKPFALMARDLSVVTGYCLLCAAERNLLESAAAPIVLLDKRRDSNALDGVAPGQQRLGFMLANTPLHHLLLESFDSPLVMTSGNPSGQPQCTDNSAALAGLSGIADLFLLHDRAIENRVDDSVAQVIGDQVQLLRRARGYAPQVLSLPQGFAAGAQVLALGGELKNTFCLLHENEAILSQHIGDLTDAATYADFERSLGVFQRMFSRQPNMIVVDRHPNYLSSNYGRRLAKDKALTLVEVQHHHAHIASCLGDNLHPLNAEPVLAVTLDGTGFAGPAQSGTESNSGTGDRQSETIWGGEIFLADYRHAQRLARLKPAALPGGDMAMLQPWRNTVAQLQQAIGWQAVNAEYGDLEFVRQLQQQPVDTVLCMIDKQVNAPLSSSCGRLFDAVAASLGIVTTGNISFEGQAAIGLEALIEAQDWPAAKPYPFDINRVESLIELDPAVLWKTLLQDLQAGLSRSCIAARFHHGLASALVNAVAGLAAGFNTHTVALTGGVFQNRHLLAQMSGQLADKGLQVLVHRRVPANDGGLAFGQALIGAARQILSDQDMWWCDRRAKPDGDNVCV